MSGHVHPHIGRSSGRTGELSTRGNEASMDGLLTLGTIGFFIAGGLYVAVCSLLQR